MVKKATAALLVAVSWGLAGCAAVEAPPGAAEASGSATGLAAGTLGRQVAAGLAALEGGELAAASRAFNNALNQRPDDAHLHVLNGLAYHLMAARGDRARLDLAETGYQVARQIDRGNVAATRLLARLYLESQRYAQARDMFAETILLDGASTDTLHGLAVAAYYAGDPALALWAVHRMDAAGGDDATALRTAALVNAAAGNAAEAAAAYGRFAALEPDPGRRSHVGRRLDQWKATLAAWTASPPAPKAEREELRPAQAPGAAPRPGWPPAEPPSAADGNRSVPIAPYWADCVQETAAQARSSSGSSYGYGGYGGYSGYGSSGSSSVWGSAAAKTADETDSLPALPSPCAGVPLPRMVLVDATIIRTDDDLTTGKGVNILDGLSIVLTGSLLDTRISGTSSAHTRVWTRGIALPANGISYSLNIFNVSEKRAEVLARPSLLALDRQPSRFFSGANITVAVAGQYKTDLEEKPVGVSLSVTPTFIDDETLLLSVKTTRSFFETATTGATFQQQVQTSKNSVTASVLAKFDQTVVISGLNERELLDDEDGVPLLRDVPLVQYLFNRETARSFNRSVLILLTPRRPTVHDAAPSATGAADKGPATELRERMGIAKMVPNLTAILEDLDDNRLYRAFRSGDVFAEDWSKPASLSRTIKEIAAFLYY